VNVALKDKATGRWWDASSSTWSTTNVQNPATVDHPGETTVGWTADLAVAPGSYLIQVTAKDAAGNKSAITQFSFTGVAVLLPPDTAAPTVAIDVPTPNQVLQVPGALHGTAADDVSVATVLVAVKDKGSGLWWDPATSSWGSYTQTPAALDAPGATSTGWSWDFGGGSGSYLVQVAAKDASGKKSTTASASFKGSTA
jgi:hypothetical protein